MAGSCNRRAILTQILPILDGLSGHLVAIYGMFNAFSSTLSVAQRGPGAIVDEIAARQARDLARVNRSVNRARNIATEAVSTAKSIASNAGSVVHKIAARVGSTLTSPLGEVFLNKALTGLSAEALERLLTFTVGVPYRIDELVGRGRISLCAQSILNMIHGGESASLAYAQLLADDLVGLATSLKGHLDELEGDLIALHGYVNALYDGQWWGEVLRDVDEARQLLELAEGQLASVEAFLDSEQIFDPVRFDAALSNVEAARNRLGPSRDLDLLSPSGASKALSAAVTDVLDIGQTTARIAENLVRVSLETEQVMDLIGAIVTLEREWHKASRKAGRFVSALQTFRTRIGRVAEDIGHAVSSRDGMSLTSKQAEWLVKLTLAEGNVELVFNKATREVLRQSSVFAISNSLFQQMRSDLLLIEPFPFSPLRSDITEVLQDVPNLAAGAPSRGLTVRGRIEAMASSIYASVRGIRNLRGQVAFVLAAAKPFSGFTDSRLETAVGLLSAFRFEGWQALLRFGRLGDLLDFNTEWLTRAGLALRCLHAVLPASPPAQRACLQELADRLRDHKAIEERLVFREDGLQSLYEQALDREEASFCAIQENTDRLEKAMEQSEEGDPNSPINRYRANASSVDGDKTLDTQARATKKKAAVEDYYLRQRGLA